MKNTLIACLISIIVCVGIIFGLHFSGIITLNLPFSTTINEPSETSGFLDNTNVEQTTGDLITTGIINDLPAEEEVVIKDPTISYPYDGSTAVTGEFTFLGNQVSGNAVYTYRVKQGGLRGGVESRWRAYAQTYSINSTKILYTDES